VFFFYSQKGCHAHAELKRMEAESLTNEQFDAAFFLSKTRISWSNEAASLV
jgi:hypothetical protein